MSQRLDTLEAALKAALGESNIESLVRARSELTLTVPAAAYLAIAKQLRDDASLKFEQLIDLAGLDYADYKNQPWHGGRFCVVSHLLSVTHNWRLRLRVFCADDEMPMLGSVIEIWPSVSWFEREAFDLFGIVFDGHPDLRRILTDYGFIGHPFRKDFPISGYVEMRYDPDTKRLVYQPVTIEPREVTPRVVREEHYGEGR